MARFCPICGRKGIKQDFCNKCISEKAGKEPIIMLGNARTKVCVICSKFLFQNKWNSFRKLDEPVKKLAENALKKESVQKARLSFALHGLMLKPGMQPEISVEAASGGKKYHIPIVLEGSTCDKCSKYKTEYFEGVLQLRNPSDNIVQFIEKEAGGGKEHGFFITNRIEKKNGIDFFMTKQNRILTLAKKLHHTFGGILKISSQLYSMDVHTGKRVYRVSAYLYASPFRKDDYIILDDRLYHITKLGKRTGVVDIVTGKRTSFEYKEGMQPIILEKKKVIVTKVMPRIEIMHPRTYESVKVENKKNVKRGQNVKVVEKNGRFWIV